jgi:signal transduction histidine kinase
MTSAIEQLVRWWRLRPLVVRDAALAAVVGVVMVVSILVEAGRDEPQLTTAGWLLLAVQVVPLAWRRRYTLPVVAVVSASSFAYGAAELPDAPLQFAGLLAFYTVGSWTPRTTSVWVGVAITAGGIGTLVAAGDSDPADLAVHLLAGLTAWALGDAARSERLRAEWSDARQADAERRAAAEERVRIARDLHDVVAHHVSVIAVQAEAAQEVLASRPDRAERAMASVADTARTALGELRRMVGALRSEDDLAPQPDVAAIADLVASVRRAGLDVTLHGPGPGPGPADGGAAPVGGLVGVAAYRVVQEALTNALRHAPGARTEVTVDVGADAVTVTVADDGGGRGGAGRAAAPAQAPGGGRGLAGMRERVTTVGGTLEAGPQDGGGFRVRAVLPRPPAPAPTPPAPGAAAPTAEAAARPSDAAEAPEAAEAGGA